MLISEPLSPTLLFHKANPTSLHHYHKANLATGPSSLINMSHLCVMVRDPLHLC